ncbi:MAG TPA: hypothetical protein VFU23_14845 [Gemmatimonadales bacterium]|nr:hypothetical protein [Gemmatimonadales bacterium]
MLFFRSEERAREWCSRRGVPLGPVVTIPQLWGLARHWYSTRLSPESRRPGPAEMRQIFGSLGLADPFWDPEAPAA